MKFKYNRINIIIYVIAIRSINFFLITIQSNNIINKQFWLNSKYFIKIKHIKLKI